MTQTLAVAALALAAGGALLAWLEARSARRARQELRRQGELTASLPGILLVFDRRLRHTLATGRGLQALGLTPGEVGGRTLDEIFSSPAREILEPACRAALEGRESHVDLPYRDRDWIVAISPAGGGAGSLVMTDVTDRRSRERRLTELASRDSLTGLWNRRRLDEELRWLVQGERPASLLVLDLDSFKAVNDALGHEAGDRLLRSVAQAIQGCVRRADLVARLGGDEFGVLLAGATAEEAAAVAEKIRAAVAAVWPMGLHGGVSIGISTVSSSGVDAFGRADRAMYAAKRSQPLRRAS
jgi:diguanylate cyclase (GGDEF)-like protein